MVILLWYNRHVSDDLRGTKLKTTAVGLLNTKIEESELLNL